MAVSAASLTYPTGEIRPEWFEGENVAASLDLRIAAGATLAPAGATTEQSDAIARAYAYRETYDAKAMAMAGNPDSVGLGDLSVTNSVGRVKEFVRKRDEWGAALSAAITAAEAVVSAPRTSSSARIVYGW